MGRYNVQTLPCIRNWTILIIMIPWPVIISYSGPWMIVNDLSMLTRVNTRNGGTGDDDDNPAYGNDILTTGPWRRVGLAHDDVTCRIHPTPRRKPEKYAKQRYQTRYVPFSAQRKHGFEIVPYWPTQLHKRVDYF